MSAGIDAVAFAEVLQLVDQVKKEEERQEAQGHQGNGGQDFPVNQAAYGFHGWPSECRERPGATC
jgi:hypothetical protein